MRSRQAHVFAGIPSVWIATVLILMFLLWAWSIRMVFDDAFITFRYSAHLVEGHGPVWNQPLPGEGGITESPVEGYSNFLWMLIMSVPIALGWDPVLPSFLLGLCFLGFNLWMVFRVAELVWAKPGFSLLALVLVGTNYTLLGFGTSGLETAMNGFLWTLALWQLLQQRQKGETTLRMAVFLGLTLGMAQLSRPDNGLLLIGAAAVFLWQARWQKHAVLALSITLTLILSPWLLWKVHFYGDLLPNTFYAKGTDTFWKKGLFYLGMFALSYGLPVIFAGLLSRAGKVVREMPFHEKVMGGFVLCWMAYLLYVGGDYIEFRQMVVVLPMLYLWLMSALLRVFRRPLVAYAGIVFLVLANVLHGFSFGIWYAGGYIAPIHTPVPDYLPPLLTFEEQGKGLGELLEHDPAILLATGAAGAILYYSKLSGLDLYGLNDRYIAREGIVLNQSPGHQRWAPFDYVQARGTHLFLLRNNHISLHKPGRVYTKDHYEIQRVLRFWPENTPLPELKVIELPIHPEFRLVCLYLKRHPRIEALGLVEFPVFIRD